MDWEKDVLKKKAEEVSDNITEMRDIVEEAKDLTDAYYQIIVKYETLYKKMSDEEKNDFEGLAGFALRGDGLSDIEKTKMMHNW